MGAGAPLQEWAPPIEMVMPGILRSKAVEPILLHLLGRARFAGVDARIRIRIRVRGGGKASQVYAVRQSVAKSLVTFYQKHVDEEAMREAKDILARYNGAILVADPLRCEP